MSGRKAKKQKTEDNSHAIESASGKKTAPMKLVRTMWGILDGTPEEEPKWEPLFKRLHEEGYSAVESCVGPFFPWPSNIKLWQSLRKKYSLEWIAQVHTCGYPVGSRLVKDHIESFRKFGKKKKKRFLMMLVLVLKRNLRNELGF